MNRQSFVVNPNGPASIQITSLSLWLIGFTAAALVLVTILLVVTVFRKRQGEWKTGEALPGDRRALTWVIAGGTAVPVIILLIIIVLSFSMEKVSAANPGASAGGLTVEVTGHQWWWEVNYPADGFETANEIHIPVGKPVTFQLTSADVVHSFWVPQLHPKLDMLPNQTTVLTMRADQPGTYQGECAEYCGLQHAHMSFLVIAQSQADYDTWISQQKRPALDPPVGSIEKKGEQAFLGSSCVYCHTIQGTNASGKLGPNLTHLASRSVIGAGTLPNTPAFLAGWVVNAQVSKPGNKMPPMDLDADQLQAILAYLESLK